LVVLSVPAQAVSAPDAGATGEVWYKVATGVIAIPAALVGLIASWNLARKTRLEAKKIEIEVREHESSVIERQPSDSAARVFAAQLSGGQRALLLLVRFIMLELTLRIWDIVPSAVRSLLTVATAGGAVWVSHANPEYSFGSPYSIMVIALVPQAIGLLLGVVYWLIVFGLGWPLLKDTCLFLNIPLKGLLDLPRLARRPGG
jgi:hypothetical protein